MKTICLMLAIILVTIIVQADHSEHGLRTVHNSQNAVAALSIHTFDGSGSSLPFVPNLGHSFLAVKNLTNQTIEVGNCQLLPNQDITVGIWSTSARTGVWYNLEAVYYEIGKYNTAVALQKTIDADQLNALNDYIRCNDRWEFFFNCSVFSVGAWNAVADGDQLTPHIIMTPAKLKRQLQRFEGMTSGGKQLNYTTAGYFDGNTFVSFSLSDCCA